MGAKQCQASLIWQMSDYNTMTLLYLDINIQGFFCMFPTVSVRRDLNSHPIEYCPKWEKDEWFLGLHQMLLIPWKYISKQKENIWGRRQEWVRQGTYTRLSGVHLCIWQTHLPSSVVPTPASESAHFILCPCLCFLHLPIHSPSYPPALEPQVF